MTKLLLIPMSFLFLFSCKSTTDHELYMSIYKYGYMNGVLTERKGIEYKKQFAKDSTEMSNLIKLIIK